MCSHTSTSLLELQLLAAEGATWLMSMAMIFVNKWLCMHLAFPNITELLGSPTAWIVVDPRRT